MNNDLKNEVIDLFKYFSEHRYYASAMMNMSAEKIFNVIQEQECEINKLKEENEKLKQEKLNNV